MVLKILDTVIGNGRVELNHCWVQLSPLLTLPLYILHSLSILFTLYSFPLPPLYSPFLHPLYTLSLTHLYPLPTSPHLTTPPLTLPLYIIFPFYPPYLIYLPTIRNCCNGASQLPLGFPPVTRAPAHMTSPHLTLPLYIPILYTSLQFFSTTFLLPFFITCHKNTPRSQDHHKKTSPPFKLPLCIPFLYSSLQFFYTPSHMTSPLLTLQLYTFSLPPLYNLHALSKFPLYILIIVYCHGTAQSLLGSPPVTRQPPCMISPPLTLPLYIPFLYILSICLP